VFIFALSGSGGIKGWSTTVDIYQNSRGPCSRFGGLKPTQPGLEFFSGIRSVKYQNVHVTVTMPQCGFPRNVFVYDANVPEGVAHILIAGMHQCGHTTGAEFYLCLEICFRLPRRSTFRLMAADGIVLLRDGALVRTGTFTVVTTSIGVHLIPLTDVLADPPQNVSVTLTDEMARQRIISGGSPSTHGVYPLSFDVYLGCNFPGPCS